MHSSAEFVFDKARSRIIFPKPISRSVIGRIAQQLNLQRGFEVGVRQGVFSKELLKQWDSCKGYFLVDLWSNPNSYLGRENKESTQEQNMRDAFENTNAWKEKISFCKNFSTVCATTVEDNSFDFGYIDARHDFKSVYEDLEAWYPKIKTGGIMSGHDYMSGMEVKVSTNGNWSRNGDGTIDYSFQAVKGAVNLFFAVRGHYVSVCSPIPSYSSWVVYKGEPWAVQGNDLLHFIDFNCFDDSACKIASSSFLLNVRAWETMNPGFLSLVWTKETISWFLKEDLEKFKTTYKNDPAAYEDMLKLRIIHKFGGTYIHESITPLQGLQLYVDQMRDLAAGPAAFCEVPIDGVDGRFVNGCEKVSRLLISGKRGDERIAKLAEKHQNAFSEGTRREFDSLKLSEEVLTAAEFNVFKSEAPFPCNSFTLGNGCVTQQTFYTAEAV